METKPGVKRTFDIDSDIRRAWTAPAEVYADPYWFDKARQRIFARSWQWIANAPDVAGPGDVLPVTVQPGVLDAPLVLTRSQDNVLRCLSNVCTHRGNVVVESAGKCSVLRCRYHGRRFGLDGRMLSMPEFDGVEDFPSAADDLRTLPLGTWGPLLFTALDPPCDFDAWIAPVRARLGWLPFDTFRYEPARSRDYMVDANWALYCDNYLEGFHIPYVHAASITGLDYGAYRTELFEHGSVQVGVARRGDDVFDLPASSPDAGQAIAGYYLWLFPSTMLNFYPWGLSMNLVEPLDVGRTRIRFLTYVWQESRLDRGAGAGLDRIEHEDEQIVEQVQRGVRSRLYTRGRYSPSREAGVHHFHRLLARFLCA